MYSSVERTPGRTPFGDDDLCGLVLLLDSPPTDHNNPAGFQGAGKDEINTPCNPKLSGCVLHKWAPNAKQKRQNSNGRNPIAALAAAP